MSGKFKLKHKDVKPNLKEKEVDARSKEYGAQNETYIED